jgi:uncharacterized protein
MPLIALPAHHYQRQPWRNGAGSTREIMRGGERPDWRVAIADIEGDCSFSDFSGYQRQLMLLSGSRLELHIDSKAPIELATPFALTRFDGAAQVRASLPDGACRAFNLMHRPEAVQAELFHRPLLGTMLFFPRPGQHWLIHLAGGQARLREAQNLLELAQGDSAWLQGEGGRVQLEGGGDLVLVRIDAAQA